MFQKLLGKSQKVGQEFLTLQEFDIDIDSIKIKNVVLVPDKIAAETFLEMVFPHHCSIYVASADRVYPKDLSLNKAVFERLSSDPNVSLVVLGYDSLSKVEVVTQKVLILDDFILGFSFSWPTHFRFQKEMDEYVLVGYIKAFFSQWEKMERIGNTSRFYQLYPGYDRKKLGRIFDLLIDHKETVFH